MFNLSHDEVLEAIYIFIREHPNCRATDIYKKISFQKKITDNYTCKKSYSSFSQIIKYLNELKSKGEIEFTTKGREKLLKVNRGLL